MPSGFSSTQKVQTLKLPTVKRRSFLAKATDSYADQLNDAHAGRYLEGRGIPLGAAKAWKLGYVGTAMSGHEDYAGRLSIPYLTPAGPLAMKFRCIDHTDCSAMGCVKYLGEPGQQDHLFGVWNFRKDVPVLALCEGELDTVIATSVAGVAAIGISGATKWRTYWGHLFEGYDEVVLLRDGDDAGRKMAENLASRINNLRVVKMPTGHDVASLVKAEGVNALLERMNV